MMYPTVLMIVSAVFFTVEVSNVYCEDAVVCNPGETQTWKGLEACRDCTCQESSELTSSWSCQQVDCKDPDLNQELEIALNFAKEAKIKTEAFLEEAEKQKVEVDTKLQDLQHQNISSENWKEVAWKLESLATEIDLIVNVFQDSVKYANDAITYINIAISSILDDPDRAKWMLSIANIGLEKVTKTIDLFAPRLTESRGEIDELLIPASKQSPQLCKGMDDCNADENCEDGICVSAVSNTKLCASDVDCADVSGWCNQGTRLCVSSLTSKYCTSNSDCENNEVCDLRSKLCANV